MKRSDLKFVLPVVVVGLVLGIWAVVTTSSIAATNNATLNVNVTVVANCTVAGTSLGFGTYTGGAAVDTSTVLDVNCQGPIPWTLGAGDGQNPLTGCVRRMTDDIGNFLLYELYTDGTFNIILGSIDGTPCAGTLLSGTGTGQTSVFGRIVGGTVVPLGNYFDNVQITVSF